MSPEPGPAALYFDPDAYLEVHGKAAAPAGGPAGLMGRQVAGKEFLDAYLTHARSDSLTAVVRARDRADPLIHLCQTHPSSRSSCPRSPARSRRPTLCTSPARRTCGSPGPGKQPGPGSPCAG